MMKNKINKREQKRVFKYGKAIKLLQCEMFKIYGTVGKICGKLSS